MGAEMFRKKEVYGNRRSPISYDQYSICNAYCGLYKYMGYFNFWDFTKKDLTFLIMVLVVWVGVILGNIFTLLRDASKEELTHSENLVKDVFEKPVVVCGIDYDEDIVFITQTEEDMSGEIIILEDVYDKDKISQLCVRWNEANPMLNPAIKHLNHKKYKGIWQAYLNGKQDAEIIISEIVNNIRDF